MNINNNYYSVAINDLKYALRNINTGFYNKTCVDCHQFVEKVFKHFIVIECMDEDPEILKTHNLKKLVRYINKYKPGFINDISDIDRLSGFYFEAGYPGDSFFVAGKEDELVALRAVLVVYRTSLKYLTNIDENDTVDVSIIENYLKDSDIS